MGRMKEVPTSNRLRILHQRLNTLAPRFREQVNEEYRWKTRTIYEKMKAQSNANGPRSGQQFTNAQDERFFLIYKELIEEELRFIMAQTNKQ
ncbi:hypothetical protein ACFOTA_12335 [Chitinophaga sp. GCM10012297]|uniref:Uncharacterized protein n=1 Tax=Chitinophaga chungangae TaxID=2821488 RepID=A0ABS3YE94_9BACT|nr:hypothetical protein [Chitinophaga chungangae]MBO9152999.1 hypothetical protein [Chitinophaga chungangae]